MHVHDSCWYSKDSKAWPGPIISTQNQTLHNTSMDRTLWIAVWHSLTTLQREHQYLVRISIIFDIHSWSLRVHPAQIFFCLLLMILASYFPYLYWCLHSFAFLPCPFVWSHRVARCAYLVESQVCLQAQLDLWTTIRFHLRVSRNFEICYDFIISLFVGNATDKLQT